jgi:molybdopterin-containing oxidoreductase family membrane subunit
MRDGLAFVRAAIRAAAHGGAAYYRWLAFLGAWFALGLAAIAYQMANGLGVTAMNDAVPWGAYIANFTFMVGMAAAAVMLVVPTYVYHDAVLHDVAILGELLAIAALVACLGFIVVDLGRPDRVWHLVPVLGRFNFPASILAWDVVVINGYLVINGYVVGYLLFTRFRGRTPDKRRYLPVLMLGVVWAIGIHTVTAFLYAGLGGRAFWHSAVLAPRFLASAFAAGPAFMILALSVVRDRMAFPVSDAALDRLRQIVAVAMLINLFLSASEIFTEMYPGTTHSASMRYLLLGLHGHHLLVPYIWSALALDAGAAVVFVTRALHRRPNVLRGACAAAVVGVWIEKGMGLVIPGFVPTPLGEVVEYSPSFVEFCVSAGVWAMGALVFTLLLKVAVPIELGLLRIAPAATREARGR